MVVAVVVRWLMETEAVVNWQYLAEEEEVLPQEVVEVPCRTSSKVEREVAIKLYPKAVPN